MGFFGKPLFWDLSLFFFPVCLVNHWSRGKFSTWIVLQYQCKLFVLPFGTKPEWNFLYKIFGAKFDLCLQPLRVKWENSVWNATPGVNYLLSSINQSRISFCTLSLILRPQRISISRRDILVVSLSHFAVFMQDLEGLFSRSFLTHSELMSPHVSRRSIQ